MGQDYKRDAEYYRQQYDDLRESQERQDERRRQEQDKARKQRARDAQENYRHPDNWSQAFTRGIALAEKEAATDEPDDMWFTGFVKRYKRAQGIWQEENAKSQLRLAELRQKMAEEEASTREAIAKRIEEDADSADIAQAMRDNQPDYLTNW